MCLTLAALAFVFRCILEMPAVYAFLFHTESLLSIGAWISNMANVYTWTFQEEIRPVLNRAIALFHDMESTSKHHMELIGLTIHDWRISIPNPAIWAKTGKIRILKQAYDRFWQPMIGLKMSPPMWHAIWQWKHETPSDWPWSILWRHLLFYHSAFVNSRVKNAFSFVVANSRFHTLWQTR